MSDDTPNKQIGGLTPRAGTQDLSRLQARNCPGPKPETAQQAEAAKVVKPFLEVLQLQSRALIPRGGCSSILRNGDARWGLGFHSLPVGAVNGHVGAGCGIDEALESVLVWSAFRLHRLRTRLSGDFRRG